MCRIAILCLLMIMVSFARHAPAKMFRCDRSVALKNKKSHKSYTSLVALSFCINHAIETVSISPELSWFPLVKYPMPRRQVLRQTPHAGESVGHFLPRHVF